MGAKRDGSQWKIKCLEYKVNQLQDIINIYQLQEREYIDYIEGLEEKVELYKRGSEKLKSQKEETEKARRDLSKLYDKRLMAQEKEIEELQAVVGALKVKVKRRDKYIRELEKEKQKEPNL